MTSPVNGAPGQVRGGDGSFHDVCRDFRCAFARSHPRHPRTMYCYSTPPLLAGLRPWRVVTGHQVAADTVPLRMGFACRLNNAGPYQDRFLVVLIPFNLLIALPVRLWRFLKNPMR